MLHPPALRSGVTLAIIFKWEVTYPEDTLYLMLALYAVLDVMLGSPRKLLPGIIMATSVEKMKDSHAVKARRRLLGCTSHVCVA